MSDRPALEDLIEVQRQFGLPDPALVEKDWFVVKALAAIAAVDAAPFRLVFGGGTALSRAHRLISRMSEDIDLKIVSDVSPSRGALGRLRDSITQALLDAGFAFDPDNAAHRTSKYKNHFTIYRLPYEPIIKGAGALRPEIQIETSAWPLRRPPVELPVSSFIAEAFQRGPELPLMACTVINETAAEKFVALTRRAGSEFAGLREKRDHTLVRHIYDLHVIRDQIDPVEFVALAREVMVADADAYGDRFPAYRDNPLAETLRAIEAITHDSDFASGYAAFRRDMVYGGAPEFKEALATLADLASRLA